MNITKINFTMTYLTRVAQDWFEIGLNQKDQDILQDQLSDWNLFVDELCQYFGLLDPVGKVANILDNLYMKLDDKISTYNMDFMYYTFQLSWENSVLYHCYYQGLPNWIQDPISIWKQEKPISFQDIYALAMTINYHYWECDCERHHTRQTEKEALESHSWKQGKAFTSSPATTSQNKANTSLAASSAKNPSFKSSLSPTPKK